MRWLIQKNNALYTENTFLFVIVCTYRQAYSSLQATYKLLICRYNIFSRAIRFNEYAVGYVKTM